MTVPPPPDDPMAFLDNGGASREPGQDRRASPPSDIFGTAQANIELIMRIPVSVKIVLGAATMPVSRLMKLGRGAVIPLDRRVGEPVDVVVNGHVIARGEVVVLDEEGSRFGVSLTEILTRGARAA
jgi:flagellar motor switch protein FliN/FliY